MNSLILGNCLEVLPTIDTNSVDFILTDPPYLVNYRDRTGRSIANDANHDWLEPAYAQMYRVLRRDALAVSFYGWTKTDLFFKAWRQAGFRIVGHIVFAKSYASSKRFLEYRHESAFLLAKGSPQLPDKPLPDVMHWKYSGNPLHPTQKPVSSLVPLIECFTQPSATVLDPFAGSGSTCAAALECGRQYIGIELDPTYHAAAETRLAALQMTARCAA